MILLHMLLEISLLSELLSSYLSFEGFDSEMHSGMVNEIPRLKEDFITSGVFSEDRPLSPPRTLTGFKSDRM